MTTPTPQQRVHGALLGLAAGDALGATLEFMPPEEIRRRHGVHTEITGGGAFGWRPGQGTDDTDLTIAVARAYADGYQLGAVTEHFLRWYRGRPRDIGGMTAASLGRIADGEEPLAAGAAATAAARGGGAGAGAGNGSLMRALPTGLARSHPDRCAREAAEISAVTHADPRCVHACVAYTAIVSALVEGTPVPEALQAGRRHHRCHHRRPPRRPRRRPGRAHPLGAAAGIRPGDQRARPGAARPAQPPPQRGAATGMTSDSARERDSFVWTDPDTGLLDQIGRPAAR
ncbi:putative ADP-ribosyl-(dinitrogen reductase) hydrolase [Parafrankia sp. Ea1.12]|uniref:ADP-ribosylglycohydrolase family protein n=1 Tax=Parafrankia sp. Ea1.12 TaxID=573499 RepID=UPI000DA52C64|nr:ADP-ribosylglycohydrolase family protein [Parafrankia sp. Ea1.12]SQD94787.1 putative ADP-ribosyl-(dinitrogen reductase) hydrolase [Parafrankia sp. Ea1.12]